MSSEAILESPNLFSPNSKTSQDQIAREYLQYVRQYPIVKRWENRCVKSHMFRFLYAGLQRHTDLRSRMGLAKGLDEIEEVIIELAKRREEEPVGLYSDIGWYKRHRSPTSKTAETPSTE
jgi:hypothetical protein